MRRLSELMRRKLMTDGLRFAEHVVFVAVGIDARRQVARAGLTSRSDGKCRPPRAGLRQLAPHDR